MEYLDQHILWWHWVVLGLVLIGIEILSGTFIIIWFGVAALVVGTLRYFYPFAFSWQLLVWSILSLLLTFIYWKWFHKHEKPLPIGQSEGEYAGIKGTIVEVLSNGRYKAYFDLPVLGDREWIVEAEGDEELVIGDTIYVSHVYGQIIKVKKGEK